VVWKLREGGGACLVLEAAIDDAGGSALHSSFCRRDGRRCELRSLNGDTAGTLPVLDDIEFRFARLKTYYLPRQIF
jgi:hypothetical protein